MKKGMIEKYFIHNGKVSETNSKGLSFETPKEIIYEVIRIIDGKPLFWEEHIERLKKSAKLLGADIEKIIKPLSLDTRKVIELNELPEKNLKILVYNLDKAIADYYIFFIESFYPPSEYYEKGVKTITCKAIRENPQAKVINNEFRKQVDASLKEYDAHEALLLNEKGEITEGSRSNILFVKGDKVYTPFSKDVLLGTTRAHILKICSEQDIDVIEQTIDLDFLKSCDGLFITGTSPKVLPISQVDDLSFTSSRNSLISNITKSFDKLIKMRIEKFHWS